MKVSTEKMTLITDREITIYTMQDFVKICVGENPHITLYGLYATVCDIPENAKINANIPYGTIDQPLYDIPADILYVSLSVFRAEKDGEVTVSAEHNKNMNVTIKPE